MIEVRITGSEIPQHDHRSFTPFLLEELKKAGIPVIDALPFRGVSRGNLSWHQDYWSTDMIFRWEE